MIQLTELQKHNLILKIKGYNGIFTKAQRRELKFQLLTAMKKNPEMVGEFVLLKSSSSFPYLQIYTLKSFEKAQRYLENNWEDIWQKKDYPNFKSGF